MTGRVESVFSFMSRIGHGRIRPYKDRERSMNMNQRSLIVAMALFAAASGSRSYAAATIFGDCYHNYDLQTNPYSWGSDFDVAFGGDPNYWYDYDKAATTGGMTVDSGTVYNSSAVLGGVDKAKGYVTLTGSGTSWQIGDELQIGAHAFAYGELNVLNGAKVSSKTGYIGGPYDTLYSQPSKATVLIRGGGSTWDNSGTLNVGGGMASQTILNVADGGKASCTSLTVNSTSRVVIDGTGSAIDVKVASGDTTGSSGGLHCSGKISISHGGSLGVQYIEGRWDGKSVAYALTGDKTVLNCTHAAAFGYSAPATISITGGAKMNVGGDLTVMDTGSAMSLSVGDQSSLSVGGKMTLWSSLNLSASAMAPAGVYAPISAGTWDSHATVTSIGGVWDAAAHTFTIASNGASGNTGGKIVINPGKFKATILDKSGKSIGASFLSSYSSDIEFTASDLTTQESSDLATAASGNTVLNGYTFEAGGAWKSGDSVLLTLDVGAGLDPSTFEVWHYSGGAWEDYTSRIGNLSYDGQYASFSVTGFSGYAITMTAVPEPAAMSVIAMASLTLLTQRCRKTRTPR